MVLIYELTGREQHRTLSEEIIEQDPTTSTP